MFFSIEEQLLYKITFLKTVRIGVTCALQMAAVWLKCDMARNILGKRGATWPFHPFVFQLGTDTYRLHQIENQDLFN